MSKQVTFLPINGFMTQQKLWLEGQIVLIDPKHLTYNLKESSLKNFYRLYKLYNSKYVKQDTLHLYYKGVQKWELKIDQTGYFQETLEIRSESEFNPNDICYYLGKNRTEVYKPEYSINNIYTIPDNQQIVISDIDDTILVSHATNKWKKITTLIKHNALQRKQVDAMNEFFQHMDKHHGFIYLSNSEMNLYPLIKNFLNKHDFPKGPLFLREHINLSSFFTRKKRRSKTNSHKERTLKMLMKSFDHKKFILVGDSGQKDPEIYFHIAREFQSQVSKIYIREITGSKKRKRLEQMKKILKGLGIDLVLFNRGKNLLS